MALKGAYLATATVVSSSANPRSAPSAASAAIEIHRRSQEQFLSRIVVLDLKLMLLL